MLVESSPQSLIIHCDADPYVPDKRSNLGDPNQWKVVSHTKGGILTWDPRKVGLLRNGAQEGSMTGTLLHARLKSVFGNRLLNANVLDALLKPENQHLIPEYWKGRCEDRLATAIFFWGTIYSYPYDGSLCVRCLEQYIGNTGWRWGHHWLDLSFHSGNPAAALIE